MLDAALALNHLHCCNLVHGDVKSPNMLVTHGFTVKIADFSMSRVVSALRGSRQPMELKVRGVRNAGVRACSTGFSQATRGNVGVPPSLPPGAAVLAPAGGPVIGSVLWTAPEVLRGTTACSKSADVYSFGVCMWGEHVGATSRRRRVS
jgi:serine/threonine protein kinase